MNSCELRSLDELTKKVIEINSKYLERVKSIPDQVLYSSTSSFLKAIEDYNPIDPKDFNVINNLGEEGYLDKMSAQLIVDFVHITGDIMYFIGCAIKYIYFNQEFPRNRLIEPEDVKKLKSAKLYRDKLIKIKIKDEWLILPFYDSLTIIVENLFSLFDKLKIKGLESYKELYEEKVKKDFMSYKQMIKMTEEPLDSLNKISHMFKNLLLNHNQNKSYTRIQDFIDEDALFKEKYDKYLDEKNLPEELIIPPEPKKGPIINFDLTDPSNINISPYL